MFLIDLKSYNKYLLHMDLASLLPGTLVNKFLTRSEKKY